ncbi:stage II sporulation protein M [Kiritimatiellota bacterium B12222]|nr:stage II sporulation protein M [Kiritimatiellota bacterium B12222]
MIVNLNNFILRRKPLWEEYDDMLLSLEQDGSRRLSLEEIQRLQTLHEHIAGDLVRVRTFASEPDTIDYLESLLTRGFGFIHESNKFKFQKSKCKQAFHAFPRTLRSHRHAFQLVVITFILGAILGGFLVAVAPDAKDVLLPFAHLHGDPSDRVAMEESVTSGDRSAMHATFAAQLMTHNIKVSIFVLVLGIFFGVFTLVLVFYNGVILGAVCVDYLLADEGIFLAGWLLPHGSVEIPAILFAATGGIIIAQSMIQKSGRLSFSARMRRIRGDLLIIISAVALLLFWAGIIESFFSQFHYPTLPYGVKISFGVLQLSLLILYLLLPHKPDTEDHT